MEVKCHNSFAGKFKIEAVRLDSDGNEISRRTAADWFPNLITEGGLERIADQPDFISYCQVGSGSTTPNINDSALSSWVAGTTSIVASSANVAASSPYYVYARKTYRFAEGVATGNLTEVGAAWLSENGLFSRALILDEFGDPTTITILSNETLDVVYELRMYPKVTDDVGTVTLTGSKGGIYNWIFRPAYVTTYNYSSFYGYAIFPSWTVGSMGALKSSTDPSAPANTQQAAAVFAGEIGAITSGPIGASFVITTSGTTGSRVAAAYDPGSRERVFTVAFPIGAANLTGGIRSLMLAMGGAVYQIRFGRQSDDATIDKTSVDTISLTAFHTWGRL